MNTENAVHDNAPKPEAVPYIVYWDELARAERHIKRLWIALIVSISIMALVVGGFLWYLSQYDYVSNEDIQVDGENGIANYIGKDGTIYNGENSSPSNTDAQEEVGEFQGNPQT